MKTENTLRMVRKSLLCFFMALGAGFLVACGNDGGGGGGGGASTFPAYFVDAPVEGAEYSGPTNPVKNTTRKNGEFEASEGVFEFSVGATPLGSVQLNSDWENSQVTPADFIGVNDDDRVVAIARVLQALDGDSNPRNGISISQTHRGLTVDLFANADVTAGLAATATFSFVATVANAPVTLNFPAESDARDHLIATRQCLFSGGYMGDYRSTVASESPEEGRDHFVFEPRSGNAISLRGVEIQTLPDGRRDVDFVMGRIGAVGVRENTFAIGGDGTLNNATLTFVTPRLVTATWSSANPADSGTSRLTRVAGTGNPTANRRVVGVETDDSVSTTVVGIYVLDYFADDGEFRGQYYDVGTDRYSVMLLTVAGGAWPTVTSGDAATTVMVTLSGTLGGGDTAVTVQVIRDTDTIGSFGGRTTGANMLDGSWCDLVQPPAAVDNGGGGGGGGGVLVPPAQPLTLTAVAQSATEIEVAWDDEVSGVTSYKLYRSESSGGIYTQVGGDISASPYMDTGLTANTPYYYQLEACNSGVCSSRSDEATATTANS